MHVLNQGATRTSSWRAVGSPVLVTGGTGTLGRLVVRRLREARYEVRVLSRHARDDGDGIEFVPGDLTSGEGVGAAVKDIEVLVHCAGSSSGDEVKTQHLLDAAARAGARHVVNISVVGADRVPVSGKLDRTMFSYFSSKLGAERVVANSGLPWTTLRATQFFDLVLIVAQAMSRLPIIPIPSGFRFQPVDADEVAARLVELALGEPAGLVDAIAGPRIYTMAELVSSYLKARGLRRLTVPLWLPGKAAGAIRAGAILTPDRAVGRHTWEEYLARRVGELSNPHPAPSQR